MRLKVVCRCGGSVELSGLGIREIDHAFFDLFRLTHVRCLERPAVRRLLPEEDPT